MSGLSGRFVVLAAGLWYTDSKIRCLRIASHFVPRNSGIVISADREGEYRYEKRRNKDDSGGSGSGVRCQKGREEMPRMAEVWRRNSPHGAVRIRLWPWQDLC